jgi:phosphate/phosphite/phosphonate ABC transporter binding protein
MRRKKLVIAGVAISLIFLSLAAFMIGRSNFAKIYVDKGDKYFEQDELDKAMVEYKKAVRIDPELTEAHLALAEIYIRKDMLDEAIEKLLKAAELEPDDKVVLARLRQVYEESRLKSTELLRFGIQPDLGSLAAVKVMQPLTDYLSKELNMNVVLILLPGYGSVIEYLKAEKVDIAPLGPLEYIKAQQEAEVVPIVVPTIQGRAVQKSVIITRADSGIRGLSDLKDKTFAFVAKDSVAGYLVRRTLLKENGIGPAKDLRGTFLLGSSDRVFFSVLNGKVDAGVLTQPLYHYLSRKSGRGDEIVILAQSPAIPQGPIVARRGLDQNLIEKLRNLLVNFHFSEEGKELLRDFQTFDGCLPVATIEDGPAGFKGYTFFFTEF